MIVFCYLLGLLCGWFLKVLHLRLISKAKIVHMDTESKEAQIIDNKDPLDIEL